MLTMDTYYQVLGSYSSLRGLGTVTPKSIWYDALLKKEDFPLYGLYCCLPDCSGR
jgi:hypothetical protein